MKEGVMRDGRRRKVKTKEGSKDVGCILEWMMMKEGKGLHKVEEEWEKRSQKREG